MNRSQAIGKIEDAMALRHLGTSPTGFSEFARDQVAVLEALGLLKFNEEQSPGLRPATKMQLHTPVGELRAGPFHGELRALRAGPAEVLARVVLGPDYKIRVGPDDKIRGPNESQWMVCPGADGADRLIEALAAAGYRIVRPSNSVWPGEFETIIIESEAYR